MYEEQLDIIRNFDPQTATHYMYHGDLIECYFAVILKNGLINITKYPSGRIQTIDSDEHILCFKRTFNNKTKKIVLYLRYKLNDNELNKEDKILYAYIISNCKLA